ncbi:MAG TPA: hypothetical protein P5081_13680 [Phycisphaerae bacterium]|nr:hypothetical protein [Phycisphaerae bacterium]HRW53921.1 hypothetical protein [Phycisphaerae bacterium]
MKSHRIMIGFCVLLAGLCATPVSAQPEKGDDGPGVRPRRPEGPGGLQRRGGRGNRGADAQLARLNDALKLDDTQKSEVQALLKAHEAKIREMRDGFRPSPEELEEMEAIREDLRRAREENDTELMAKCRDRMRAAREARNERTAPAREAIEAAEAKLHDDILEKLNDDQKKAFDEVWNDVMDRRGRRGGSKYDPRLLQRVVSRVKGLSTEQEESVEKLFSDFREADKKARRTRPERPGRKEGEEADKPQRRRDNRRMRDDAASKKLFDDVMAVLTEAQQAEVRTMMEKASGKRGERGERGRRGRGDADGRDGPGRFRDGDSQPKKPADSDDD